MKLFFSAFVLFLFCFSNSTCKKIDKFPIDMTGTWIAANSDCGNIILEIKENGHGEYGPNKACGKGAHMSGKARFTNEALFLGFFKLKFVKKPENGNGKDSTMGKLILAKMTVQEPIGFAGNIQKMFKLSK